MHPAKLIGQREATLHGIPTNVLNHTLKMFFVTDNSIVGFLFPESARPLGSLIDLTGGDPLDFLEDVFEFESFLMSNHNMAVIRHDDAATEKVLPAMPKEEALLDNGRMDRVLQLTPPVTFVERALESARHIALIPFPKFHTARVIPQSGEFSSDAPQL